MHTIQLPYSTLTQNQSTFLLSNKLLSVIEEDSLSFTYLDIFTKDVLRPQSSNIPLNDSVFLYYIFEFINLYLYLYAPQFIIPTKNKEHICKIINSLNRNTNVDNGKFISSKYVINLYKHIVTFNFSLFDCDYKIKVPFNKECSVLSYSSSCEVDNTNEFLYKIIALYEDIISKIPNEDLDI